jgi:hypothetical protein
MYQRLRRSQISKVKRNGKYSEKETAFRIKLAELKYMVYLSKLSDSFWQKCPIFYINKIYQVAKYHRERCSRGLSKCSSSRRVAKIITMAL